jgi:hypothetical protein
MIGGGGGVPWSDSARGGAAVTFDEVLNQTIAMLQQHGRFSYHALKRQFALDDAVLADLKYKPIEVQQRLVETGVLVGERGEYRLAKPPASVQVPATIHAVLAARIDRPPP